MKKTIITCLMTGFLAFSASAQVSGTLSPYSQFGLGTLADQSQGFNRGMNGLAIGLRDSRIANMQNPASYSAIDSLTMVIDAGVSGQLTNFKEGGKKLNRRTADFDYVAAVFRVMPKMGVSVGIVPFSNIGYSYYSVDKSNNNLTATSTYSGTGGFSQAYIGVGWEVMKGLSLGGNISYFWGDYSKSVVNVSNDSYAKTLTKTYSASVNSYKLDFGAQWQQQLDKKNLLTIGLTAGIGHNLGAQANLSSVTSESQNSTSFESTDSVPDAFSLPYSFGIGATLLHKNSLIVGADYTLQRWGALDFPQVNETTAHYGMASGLLKDRHKVTLGLDWVPDAMSPRKFFRRVHYRMGASYATPYYNIQGHDGPTEFSVSAGVGIPILNTWNNRSVLNISAQWTHSSAKDFITENAFRINIGLTFNERWFAKWKVD